MKYQRGFDQSDGTSVVKDLKKGCVLRIKGHRSGQAIRCLNGMVWITQQGNNDDRYLSGGDIYHSDLPSFALIQALNDAVVNIRPEGKKRSAGWIPNVWHRILSHA